MAKNVTCIPLGHKRECKTGCTSQFAHKHWYRISYNVVRLVASNSYMGYEWLSLSHAMIGHCVVLSDRLVWTRPQRIS